MQSAEDSRIARRWLRWAYLGVEFKDRHAAWMTYIMRRGVSVRAVGQSGMDDPRLGDEDREALLEGYLARREGRVKL